MWGLRLGLRLPGRSLLERSMRSVRFGFGLPGEREVLERQMRGVRLRFRLQRREVLERQMRGVRLGLGLSWRTLLERSLLQRDQLIATN
jgi:hypothetical protein